MNRQNLKTILLVTLLAVLSMLIISGCTAKEKVVTSSEQPLEESAQETTEENSNTKEESTEDSKPVVTMVEKELIVNKIAASQEGVIEKVKFTLEFPENMTVSYEWNGEETDIPTVFGENDWYMQTSSMSSGVTEDDIVSRLTELGAKTETLDINGYKIVLAIEPSEKYSAITNDTKLADGFDYTYYILFEDESILPLTFFSETENDSAKQEFEGVVKTFKVVA